MNSNFRAIASDCYHITDRKSYIRRLYLMLGLLGPAKTDRRFRERVKEVQKRGGIPADGTVDYRTYCLILSEYRNSGNKEVRLFDSGEDIYRLNSYIALLIKEYNIPVRRPKGRIMGVDGIRASRLLRKIYGLPDAECIDTLFLRAIERDIRSINAINGSG